MLTDRATVNKYSYNEQQLTFLTWNKFAEIKYIWILPNSVATAATQTTERYVRILKKVAKISKTTCCLGLYKVQYYSMGKAYTRNSVQHIQLKLFIFSGQDTSMPCCFDTATVLRCSLIQNYYCPHLCDNNSGINMRKFQSPIRLFFNLYKQRSFFDVHNETCSGKCHVWCFFFFNIMLWKRMNKMPILIWATYSHQWHRHGYLSALVPCCGLTDYILPGWPRPADTTGAVCVSFHPASPRTPYTA